MINRETFVNYLVKILYYCLFIVLTLIGTMAVMITANLTFDYTIDTEGIHITLDNILINIFGILAFITLVFGCLKIVSNFSMKKTLILTLGILLILGSIWAIFVGQSIPIRADQQIIYEIGEQFNQNNYEALLFYKYLGKYPYQIGIVTFLELLIKLFNHETIMIMRLINVIAVTVASYYIYKITDILFNNETTNKLVLILNVLFIPLVFITTFVYGNVIGLAFGIMAIYYTLAWIKNKTLKDAVLIIIAITISIILKSNYKIYLAGIVIILLLEALKKLDIKALIITVAIITVPCLTQVGLKAFTSNRSEFEIKDGIPMIAFVYMGIQEGRDGRASGWYNGLTEYIFYRSGLNTEKAKENSIELIEHRLGEFMHKPEYAISFFTGKIISTWCEPTYQSIWINAPLDKYEEVKDKVDNNKFLISFYSGKISKIISKYLDVFQIIIYLICASFAYEESKNINLSKAILGIIFFGGVLFHLMWETKSLYVLMYVILLLPYVSEGLRKMFIKTK